MTAALRTPWWGADAVEMQLALPKGQRFRPCREPACGIHIMLVRAPRGEDGHPGNWVPVQIVGYDEKAQKKVIAFHADLCSRPDAPANKDPQVSHRVTGPDLLKEPETSQVQFRLRQVDLRPGSISQEG